MTEDERKAIEHLLQTAEMAYLFAEGWHSGDDLLLRPTWIAELERAYLEARAYFPDRSIHARIPIHYAGEHDYSPQWGYRNGERIQIHLRCACGSVRPNDANRTTGEIPDYGGRRPRWDIRRR